jgi:4-diphosphocytidyl-2-C-methyl-D-erythritol kinase
LRSNVSTPASVGELTLPDSSDRINEFGRLVSGWLSGLSPLKAGKALSGVPGSLGRGRAGNPLLDLVRTGIENDFEQVVFPKYPELREVKQVLKAAGAFYASLSGSGSAIYGLFESSAAAKRAVARLQKNGIPSVATRTLRRQQYWKEIFDC